eukprot:1992356-Rhodomonas_salina.3
MKATRGAKDHIRIRRGSRLEGDSVGTNPASWDPCEMIRRQSGSHPIGPQSCSLALLLSMPLRSFLRTELRGSARILFAVTQYASSRKSHPRYLRNQTRV